MRVGSRPTPDPATERGECQHGWQCFASSSLEHHLREAVVLAQSSAADARSCAYKPQVQPVIAHLQDGPDQSLRLPPDVTEATCARGGFLDNLGHHRAACPHCVGTERTGVGHDDAAGTVLDQFTRTSRRPTLRRSSTFTLLCSSLQVTSSASSTPATCQLMPRLWQFGRAPLEVRALRHVQALGRNF